LGFISEDERTMVDYVKNVDVLFANKRCVELLDEARRLIMSDIHNIVQVANCYARDIIFSAWPTDIVHTSTILIVCASD